MDGKWLHNTGVNVYCRGECLFKVRNIPVGITVVILTWPARYVLDIFQNQVDKMLVTLR